MKFNKKRNKFDGKPYKFFALIPYFCEDIGQYVWLEYIYLQWLSEGTPDYEFGVVGELIKYFKHYKTGNKKGKVIKVYDYNYGDRVYMFDIQKDKIDGRYYIIENEN